MQLFSEHRLIRRMENSTPSSSYIGRFAKHFTRYDYTNPAHIAAAGTHFVTQFGGLDPLARDAARMIHREQGPIPALGNWGRVGEDITFIQSIKRREYLSAATKVMNLGGDLVADAADSLTIH